MADQFLQEWKPQYPMAAAAADAVDAVDAWAHQDSPTGGKSPLGYVSDAVGVPALGRVLRAASYGQNDITKGRGQTLSLTDDALDAAGAVAMGAGAASKASRVAGKVAGEVAADAMSGPLHMSGSRGAQKGIFAGFGSKTADLKAADDAYELGNKLSGGKPSLTSAQNNEVRQTTGWMFDPADKKWKYEIDDSKSKTFLYGEHLTQKKTTGNIDTTHKLGDVFEHEDLYKAYPQLKDYTVEVTSKLPNEVFGQMSGTTMKINANLVHNSKEVRSTILHELEHAVQDIEGHGRGGSSAYIRDQSQADFEHTFQRANAAYIMEEAKKIHIMENVPPEKAFLCALADNQHALKQEDIDFAMKNKDKILDSIANEKLSTLQSWKKKLNDELSRKSPLTTEEAFQKYRRLPGEVMSRNVEARADMGPAQRSVIDPLAYRGDTPWGSMDVPPEEIDTWPPTKYKPAHSLASKP